MARAAVGELCIKHGVIFGLLTMTIETPAHVHHLRILIHSVFAYITVAIFAVQSCGNVWSVDIMYKIRYLRDRYPINRLIVLNIFRKFRKFRTLNGDLLMAAPAFGLGGNAG